MQVIQGDCRDVLAGLPAESVHCVVTSPPYWGLRDYGIPPTVWGGNQDCEHKWGANGIIKSSAQQDNGPHGGGVWNATISRSTGNFCQHCNAWSGALGLEPTFQLYVEHMVEVFRAVRRVLRADGTLWLNLGDTYGSLPNGKRESRPPRLGGLKEKDMCGIPWRVAFALQDDGWYLRQDIIWAKPNPMPESVTDRCTKSHEYLFLLSKSARYYFDAEAIKEDCEESYRERPPRNPDKREGKYFATKVGDHANGKTYPTRNKRSVWTIATSPFPEAHFATFPTALIEPCIKAGTSERGCCAKCGTPLERLITKVDTGKRQKMADGWDTGDGGHGTIHRNGREKGDTDVPVLATETIGWRATCKCDAAVVVVPCTVLDPFGGAGTTGLVADRLQRNSILIELNPSYVEMARRRVFDDSPLFQHAHTQSKEDTLNGHSP